MGGSGRARAVWCALAGAALVLAACTSGAPRPEPPPPEGTVVVGSFDFPESEVLAEIYGQALRAKGLPVQMALNLGPRELVEPALVKGLLGVIPEYQGSALDFFAGAGHATDDAAATHAALERTLVGTGTAALASAEAEDANAFAVSAATADRYGLTTISDLAPVAGRLVLGGPPECPERPLCLLGLRGEYGLRFRAFVPLDAGGPLTVSALSGGDVDVALVFTTDPTVAQRGFRLLVDDRGLEPAENVTPVVSRALLRRYGDRLRSTLEGISGALTTDQLIGLNRAVQRGGSAQDVAGAWLAGHGLD